MYILESITYTGEKISLGLSVFLAFSMFMLLIAEEVPATSESVPLIGNTLYESFEICVLQMSCLNHVNGHFFIFPYRSKGNRTYK